MNGEIERTLEQVYRSAVAGLYARLRSNYDFMYEKFGEDGLKMIEDMSHEYGVDVADRARAKLAEKDLASVASYLTRIFETIGYGKKGFIESVPIDERRIVIKLSQCPLHFGLPAMCQAHTAMEKTVVEELNPELTYRIGKSIPAGDAFCEHIVEIK